jgi:shikimate dehydrogenase/3-dehydroquinate dehydratase type I
MICVSVAGRNATEIIEKGRAAEKSGADMVEFRLDSIVALSEQTIREVASSVRTVKIATLKGDSVRFLSRPDAQQLFSGFDFIDIDISDAESMDIPEDIRRKIIASFHGKIRDEGEARAIIRRELMRYAVAKCITAADSIREASVIVRAVPEEMRGRVIAFSLGREGMLTRIISMKSGCPWAYASLSRTEQTAEGQFAFEEMMDIEKGMLLLLIGGSVEHSLSPLIQNYALRRCGIQGRYFSISVKETAELGSFLEQAVASDARGINVTMPYKQDVLPYLHSLSAEAQRIQAVNTIVNRQGKLEGHNTDFGAFRKVISGMQAGKALIFGAGGAARAAVAALDGWDITVYSRSSEKAEMLLKTLGGRADSPGKVSRYDLLVNCTPLGMDGVPGRIPDKIAACAFDAVIDFVYSRGRRPFEELARSRGTSYVGGERLLALQAAESFRLWTGVEPPVEEMIALLEREANA